MEIIEITGRELNLLERTYDWEKRNINSITNVEEGRYKTLWGNGFKETLVDKGLLKIENDLMFLTELAINSVINKKLKERLLIEEYIDEDFEYAFLLFMFNRNHPVSTLQFPKTFEFHSKIHGQPIEGSNGATKDWMYEIMKYVHDPTIEGFVLNDIGKQRFEKLRKQRELKSENDRLELEIKRESAENSKFSRRLAYGSLIVAGLSALSPIVIYLMDKGDVKKTQTELIKTDSLMQIQVQTQKNLLNLLQTRLNQDTSKKFLSKPK